MVLLGAGTIFMLVKVTMFAFVVFEVIVVFEVVILEVVVFVVVFFEVVVLKALLAVTSFLVPQLKIQLLLASQKDELVPH